MRQYQLIGVPFDSESSLGWPGSRFAPARIRESLKWIVQRIQGGEIYRLETDTIERVGDALLVDGGDVAVAHDDTKETFARVSEAVSRSIRVAKVPIVLGGDDSLLFPVARGLHDALPGRLGIVHFDAHLDLLDESDPQGRLSQSSGMRRALELERVSADTTIQVAERHFNFPSSGAYKHANGLAHIPARQVLKEGVGLTIAAILKRMEDADHVFLSFDIDSIDPAHAPGAGAHEPGGLTSAMALEMVEALAGRCVGMAITEVNPMMDHKDMTSTLAAYLAFTFALAGRHATGGAQEASS